MLCLVIGFSIELTVSSMLVRTYSYYAGLPLPHHVGWVAAAYLYQYYCTAACIAAMTKQTRVRVTGARNSWNDVRKRSIGVRTDDDNDNDYA